MLVKSSRRDNPEIAAMARGSAVSGIRPALADVMPHAAVP